MSICIRVCVYMYIYVYTCTYVSVCICVVFVDSHAYVYVMLHYVPQQYMMLSPIDADTFVYIMGMRLYFFVHMPYIYMLHVHVCIHITRT